MAAKRRTISQRSELLYDLQEYGVNPDTREIWIHSYIGPEDEPGVDYRMAVRFEKNLNFLQTLGAGPILVHMHCIGGNWTDGMGIYDAIKACHETITILTYAQASSMSSVILQAADYRVFMPNTHVFIHQIQSGMSGSLNWVELEAEFHKRVNRDMLNIYAEKAVHGAYFTEKGATVEQAAEELHQLMIPKEGLYLTPRQAIHYGLGDAVLGDEGYETIKELRE